jgi:hypothetical protein
MRRNLCFISPLLFTVLLLSGCANTKSISCSSIKSQCIKSDGYSFCYDFSQACGLKKYTEIIGEKAEQAYNRCPDNDGFIKQSEIHPCESSDKSFIKELGQQYKHNDNKSRLNTIYHNNPCVEVKDSKLCLRTAKDCKESSFSKIIMLNQLERKWVEHKVIKDDLDSLEPCTQEDGIKVKRMVDKVFKKIKENPNL